MHLCQKILNLLRLPLLLKESSMSYNIIEFKAKVPDPEGLENILKSLQPIFKGEDHQIDTYFMVKEGRLKLREGNIENALIWYDRPNDASAKLSQVLLYKHDPDPALKDILFKVHDVKVVVDKKRRIYFIDNVKFHFDEVKGLGKFIEVEAIDHNGELGLEKIQAQCDQYAALFQIQPQDYVAISYSDLLMNVNNPMA
jgi:predicted adenylyl cyclase CyaB